MIALFFVVALSVFGFVALKRKRGARYRTKVFARETVERDGVEITQTFYSRVRV